MQVLKEQGLAINHNNGNMLVSASAGSGKTFVMIERANRLIVEGKATVKDILMVTFTELAAGEMKERLKQKLIKQANGNERIIEQIMEISTADICTLHSFCTRLIRKYFFEVDLTPDFNIADENLSIIYKSQAIDKTFLNLYSVGEKWFVKLTDRYKSRRKDQDFKDMLVKMYDISQIEAYPQQFLKKYQALYGKNSYKKIVNEYQTLINKTLELEISRLEQAIKVFTDCEEKPYISYAETILTEIKKVYGGGVYACLNAPEKFATMPSARLKGEKSKAQKEALAEVRKQFLALCERVKSHLTTKERDEAMLSELYIDAENITKILNLFQENYSKLKLEDNILDYEDLQHYALKILNNPEILSEIKDKYKYIFVDEYQDTNGIQEEIITKISKDNVFMVGDVKQSIYGFRGCRPEFFENKFDLLSREGDSAVRLNYNFRSAKNVVDGVNQIFCHCMNLEAYGADYASSSMLVYGNLYGDHKGRTEIHRYIPEKQTRQKQKPEVYDVSKNFLVEEDSDVKGVSCMIAEIIKKELASTYFDLSTGEERAINYSDIALISRTNKSSDIYPIVQGLRKLGVPISSAISENVLDYAEVILLVNALELMDNFYQDIPLVSVMKSPIGKFTEEELAKIVIYYKDNYKVTDFKEDNCFYKAVLYYLKNANGELFDKLALFKNYFDEIRYLSDFIGAKEILNKLVTDSYYEHALLASAFGEVKVKRVRKFISEAESQGVKLTVREFIKKIKTSSKGFEMTQDTPENTVKTITAHSSKGLEFPVVILCGLEVKKRANNYFKTFISDSEYGFALNYFNDAEKTVSETLVRGLIKEKQKLSALKEDLRLFYVASTRAKYSLHLTYKASSEIRKSEFFGSDCFAECIPLNMPVTEWREENLIKGLNKNQIRKVFVGEYLEKDYEKMQKCYAFKYQFTADTTLTLKTSATELGATEELLDEYYLTQEKGKTGAEAGIIAHKILENLDFNDGDFYGQINSFIENKTITSEELSLVNTKKLFNAIKTSEIFPINDKKVYKEQKFIAHIPASELLGVDSNENVLVQGVIDLLIVSGDSAEIIDYKYSKLSTEGLKKKYAKQLDIYASAVSKALKKKVDKKIIVNIFTGETVEV